MLTWWSREEEAESAPNVVFTSKSQLAFLEASGDRGKISGVWEDHIPSHVFTFSKQGGKALPSGNYWSHMHWQFLFPANRQRVENQNQAFPISLPPSLPPPNHKIIF